MAQDSSDLAKSVIRRNTDEVQGGGDWALFEELFSDDFYDHTRIGLPSISTSSWLQSNW